MQCKEKEKHNMENNLKEIREFINQWKVRAINYYHEAIEDFQKDLKKRFHLFFRQFLSVLQ